ncbi:Very-long-chain (3R)-3-hydroxyacyl-CoA dehydratase 2 [Holothuria leucospilota]|uniref:Very-long-chain (3R)-3-hydroxyacyl-CoA dehydratase n=1 Tax=Holothuria leucospilota TaxID=206669 RepID=A0A9Q0YHL3_HOLLE|nr:Very-long-chain (3R)-3-hydroxyacyl-CoA dehydratase 2 [Holothuria leucospilota]
MGSEAEEKAKKSETSGIATAYLVLYNVVLCAGWLSIGAISVRHYVQTKSIEGLYDNIELPLKVFQTAAVLEIFHCAVGIVRSSAFLTGMQVFSRVFIVWGVTHSVLEVQDEPSVALYVICWTITEIIRYAFYTFGLLNQLPYILTWLRYTLFIVLYPCGVIGELWTTYNALPHVQRTGLYSVSLPNDYNISFDFYKILIIWMFLYIPFFPRLFSHMLHQRRKVIGGQGGKKTN